MAETYSTMESLDFTAPSFKLYDTISDNYLALKDLKGKKATFIMFICNHCPFVKHVNQALVKLAHDYMTKGIAFIAISSNDVENYPQDSPEKMKKVAQKLAYSFPYLYDESQDVAKAYKAVCTPDFFLFDQDLKCVYRGRLDDSRPGKGISTGQDIRRAFDNVLKNQKPIENQKPSLGCNIKWKI